MDFHNVPPWMSWVIAISALLIAAGVIWKVFRSFVKAFNKIDRLVSVIDPVTRIAEDFKRNGGHSLRDAVDRIDKASITAAANAEVAVRMSTTAAEKTEALQQNVSELSIVVRRSAEDQADNGRLLIELQEHSLRLNETQKLMLERGRILRRGDLGGGEKHITGRGKAKPSPD